MSATAERQVGHRIEYRSRSDEHGRCSFTLFWWKDYQAGHPDGENVRREHGQNFFADPRTYGHPRPEEARAALAQAGMAEG